MEEEASRQEEAKRILESIRHRENDADEEQEPQKPISRLPEEEADKLKELVAKRLGLNNEPPVEENLPDPDSIDPISTEQIQVMRKFATNTVEEQKSLRTRIINSVIKAYFDIADSFKLKPDSARRCFTEGHQCAQCGKKIPFVLVEQYEKSIKEKGKENNPPSPHSPE